MSYDQDGLTALASMLRKSNRMLFARVRISPEDAPRFLPEKDGVVIKDRVRKAVAAAGLTMSWLVVMVPMTVSCDVHDDADASRRAAVAGPR